MKKNSHSAVENICKTKGIPFDANKLLALTPSHCVLDHNQDRSYLVGGVNYAYIINCKKNAVYSHVGMVEKMLLADLNSNETFDFDLFSLPDGNIEKFAKTQFKLKDYLIFVSFYDYLKGNIVVTNYAFANLSKSYYAIANSPQSNRHRFMKVATVETNFWDGPRDLEELERIIEMIKLKFELEPILT